MKPVRNIIILVLVIALLGGGMYFISQYEPKQEETVLPELPETVTMFKTEKSNITAVTVTLPEETYTVSLENGAWLVNNDPDILISQSRVETLLYECANIVAKELLEENAQNLVQYGLDNPNRTVQITLADGSKTTVLLGHNSIENTLTYLMLEGETKVYTKSTSGCENLAGPLSNLLSSDIYSIAGENIKSIAINRQNAESIELVLENVSPEGEEPTYEWQMTKPIQKTANSYNITERLLTNILTQTAVVSIAVPEAGKDYGLNQPKATYTLSTIDGVTHTVQVGNVEGANTYIRLTGNNMIYQVATEKLDFLSLGYHELVDKLVHLENILDVEKVTLDGLGKSHVMEISGSGDNATYKIDGKKIEESNFKKAYQAVLALSLDDFITQPYSGAAEFTICYYKNDGSQSVISCVPYDERNYLVLVNGEGNLLVRKKQIDNMLSTVESFVS